MKILNKVGDTDRDTLKLAFEKAFDILGVREDEKQDAVHWNIVKQKVSSIMLSKIRGRTRVQDGFKGLNTKDWSRLSYDSPLFLFPDFLTNDQKKLDYLNDAVLKNGLSLDIYYEMITVLKSFKKKDVLKDFRKLKFV